MTKPSPDDRQRHEVTVVVSRSFLARAPWVLFLIGSLFGSLLSVVPFMYAFISVEQSIWAGGGSSSMSIYPYFHKVLDLDGSDDANAKTCIVELSCINASVLIPVANIAVYFDDTLVADGICEYGEHPEFGPWPKLHGISVRVTEGTYDCVVRVSRGPIVSRKRITLDARFRFVLIELGDSKTSSIEGLPDSVLEAIFIVIDVADRPFQFQ